MQKHGSIPYDDCERLNIDPFQVIDFSASVNPHTLPFDYKGIVSSLNPAVYPDRDSRQFKKVLSEFYTIPQQCIVPCGGTTEIIYALPQLWSNALLFGPTYGDYSDAYEKNRKVIDTQPFSILTTIDGEKLKTAIGYFDWEIAIIVNPNNPTGEYCEYSTIEKLCASFPDRIICVDEAYQEMGINCSSVMKLTHKYDNLLVLRSLTKSYGIAGVRGGYAVCSEMISTRLYKCLIPWNINTVVQAIVPEIFSHHDAYEIQWDRVKLDKEKLCNEIEDIGYTVTRNKGPFFQIQCIEAAQLRMELLQNYYIHVRDCSSFGMKNVIRIMPGTKKNNMFLIKALKELYNPSSVKSY